MHMAAEGRPSRLGTWTALVGLTIVATAGCLGVALLNGVWFEVLNSRLGLSAPIPRALLFSSFLLLLGGAVVWRDPRGFGLSAGSIRRQVPLILTATLASGAVTWAILRLIGSTPYSDASWFVEVILVPASEELVFRAVFLTLLLAAVVRFAPGVHPVRAAVPINAFAFGIAHAANALTVSPVFVAMQVLFAIALGLVCASLMARTRSVYPAMLAHATVNWVVVGV